MRNESEWELSDKLHAFLVEHVYEKRYNDWTMNIISDRARQRTHGDVEFVNGNTHAYVDEKAYSHVWNGCLIELIQDVETKDLGWFFTLDQCTHLICGYYADRKDMLPRIVYKLSWPDLRDTYLRLCEDKGLWHKVTSRGYGKTIFAVVPWGEIKSLNTLWDSSVDEDPGLAEIWDGLSPELIL